MMYLKKILTLFVVLGFCTYLNSATNCECGSHATGILAYTVSGTGCCTDQPYAQGWEHSYVWNEGAWAHAGSTSIPGQVAQDRCCGPT